MYICSCIDVWQRMTETWMNLSVAVCWNRSTNIQIELGPPPIGNHSASRTGFALWENLRTSGSPGQWTHQLIAQEGDVMEGRSGHHPPSIRWKMGHRTVLTGCVLNTNCWVQHQRAWDILLLLVEPARHLDGLSRLRSDWLPHSNMRFLAHGSTVPSNM